MFVPGPKSSLEWLHWGSWAWQEKSGLFKAANLCSSQELAHVYKQPRWNQQQKHSVSLGSCLQNISAALEPGFICAERLQCQKAKQWQQGWKKAATSASWALHLAEFGSSWKIKMLGWSLALLYWMWTTKLQPEVKGIWVTIQKGHSGVREENSRVELLLADFWEFSHF